MIRFRVGQSWKREETGPQGPRDAFSFELDGVNLVPGASDEALMGLMRSLVDGVSELASGGRAGQLSLDDVHLEVCFWRRAGTEVETSVIDIGKSPRRLRGTVRIELVELVDAATSCARGFLREEKVRLSLPASELGSLEAKLRDLGGTVIREVPPAPAARWVVDREATGGLGFRVEDPDGRTLSFSKRSSAALPPLLCDGVLTFPSGDVVPCLPFLSLLGFARAASGGDVLVAKRRVKPQAVFEAGLDLCVALRQRSAMLGANPWVETLQVRCTEGLARLRPVAAAPASELGTATRGVARTADGAPLSAPGVLRRVRLTPRWSRQVALGEEGGRVILTRGLIMVASPHAVHAFSTRGATRFRRLAPRGLAAAPNGDLLAATSERLVAWRGGGSEARWVRDHDGASIGPKLSSSEGMWITRWGARGVVGIHPLTGREVWRLDPPRTQASHLAVIGSRVLLGTDGGSMYGMTASDGQVRFRVNSNLPCVGPALPVGARAINVLSRADHTTVFMFDPLGPRADSDGGVTWTRELALSHPCAPVAGRGRVFVGGGRDGRARVVCLGIRGQVIWERAVPCDAARLSLAAWQGGVIVADARGSCARLSPDGTVEWVVGSTGDELERPIPVSLRRRLAVVPGPVLRVVDPTGGRVLAELDVGHRLADLAVDGRFNLYAYTEPGELQVWAPGTLLSVVS